MDFSSKFQERKTLKMAWLCYLYQQEVEKKKKKRTKVNHENNNRRLLT